MTYRQRANGILALSFLCFLCGIRMSLHWKLS